MSYLGKRVIVELEDGSHITGKVIDNVVGKSTSLSKWYRLRGDNSKFYEVGGFSIKQILHQ